MPGSNSAVNNLMFGLAIAGGAQVDADNANRRAMDAETRARAAELEVAGQTTDSDLESQADYANKMERIALNSVRILRQQKDELQVQHDELQATLNDWMHTNEAFKRLARQYGKNLGITPEKGQEDFNQKILDAAEENPRFSDTNPLKRAQTAKHSPKL